MNLPPAAGAAGLPLRLGEFDTILAALDYAAAGNGELRFYSGRGELDRVLSHAELRARAVSRARRLLGAGLRPGERAVLIGETGPGFPITLFACLHAGIVPCIAPAETNVLARDSYLQRIAGIVSICEASVLLAPAKFDAAGRVPVRLLRLPDLDALPEADANLRPARSEEVAYVQFSSGSTTQPKGVLISHRALMANVAAILRHGICLTSSDRAFSWLPFYHDMGLVGFLLAPLAGQCSVDYLAPSAFARRPALWLQLMSRLGSTIGYAPTFGYRLAAERVRDSDLAGVDLSRWRLAGIGGDMIRIEVLEQFADRFAAAGFARKAFLPSYGLAEATLAVSFAGEGLRTASPSGEPPEAGAGHVVCGRPLPGKEVRIAGADGEPVREGCVGRILVRGPSLMSGYLRHSDAGLRITEDGFLDTGDLGFMSGGALVVTGRAKDIILVNGRNIWPADIEWTAQRAAGLRHGQTVAFSVPGAAGSGAEGTEQVVVLVESRDRASLADCRLRIADAVSRQIGVAPEIVFVPPRTIAMTSSGKLQRAAARNAYLAGTLPQLDAVTEAGTR